jgi:hypothetical protein
VQRILYWVLILCARRCIVAHSGLHRQTVGIEERKDTFHEFELETGGREPLVMVDRFAGESVTSVSLQSHEGWVCGGIRRNPYPPNFVKHAT